jgi:hypothetical protein
VVKIQKGVDQVCLQMHNLAERQRLYFGVSQPKLPVQFLLLLSLGLEREHRHSVRRQLNGVQMPTLAQLLLVQWLEVVVLAHFRVVRHEMLLIPF